MVVFLGKNLENDTLNISEFMFSFRMEEFVLNFTNIVIFKHHVHSENDTFKNE